MSKQNIKFLEFLRDILNQVFKISTFQILDDPIIHIYSKHSEIGIHNMVADPKKLEEYSLSELFPKLKQLFEEISKQQFKDKFKLKRLIIITTNNEEKLIEDFIEFLRKKHNINYPIEFWGWETIQQLFEKFKYFAPEEKIEVEHFINNVPTANIYQLFGIDEILAKIDEKIDSSINPVVIHNPLHGTGKTAIALAYIFHYDYQNKFDHIAYVETVFNLKLDFIRAFDGYANFYIRPDISLQQNVVNLIQKLNKINGRKLIIFDGIRTPYHIAAVTEIARKLNGWKVLITSSSRIYTYENIYLNHPDDQNAIKIFKYFAKDKAKDDELIKQITDKVSNHPFAIVFLAKAFAFLNTDEQLSLEQFIKILEKYENKNIQLATYLDKTLTKNQINLQKQILKYILAVLEHQFNKFSELERTILTNFSVFPSKLINFDTLKILINPTNEDLFSDTLLILLSKGWLEADKNKFRISPYVRMILHKKFRPTPKKLNLTIEILKKYIEERSLESLQWLDLAMSTVKSLVYVNEDIAELAAITAQLLHAFEVKKEAFDFYRISAAIYEKILITNKKVHIIENLAKIYTLLEEYEKALLYAHELNNLFEVEYYDIIKWADTKYIIAEIYYKLGDLNNAYEFAQQAYKLYSENLPYNDIRVINSKNFLQQIKNQLKKQSDQENLFNRFLE